MPSSKKKLASVDLKLNSCRVNVIIPLRNIKERDISYNLLSI